MSNKSMDVQVKRIDKISQRGREQLLKITCIRCSLLKLSCDLK